MAAAACHFTSTGPAESKPMCGSSVRLFLSQREWFSLSPGVEANADSYDLSTLRASFGSGAHSVELRASAGAGVSIAAAVKSIRLIPTPSVPLDLAFDALGRVFSTVENGAYWLGVDQPADAQLGSSLVKAQTSKSGEATLSTVIDGPADVSFWWKTGGTSGRTRW